MRTIVLVLATLLAGGESTRPALKPLGHWPLRKDTGQPVTEAIKAHKAFLGANPTADKQDPTWADGALVFDGKDDCVTVGDGADFVLTDKGTLAGWVKLDTKYSKEGAVIIKPSNWYFVINSARQPQFIYYTKDVFSGMRMCIYMPGRTHLRTDRWIHVAVSFGGRAIRFYVNGRLDSSRLFEDDVLVATPRPVRIGCEAQGGRPLKGAIAGVSIYNRVLTAYQIAGQMGRTDPRTESERANAAAPVGAAAERRDASGIQW